MHEREEIELLLSKDNGYWIQEALNQVSGWITRDVRIMKQKQQFYNDYKEQMRDPMRQEVERNIEKERERITECVEKKKELMEKMKKWNETHAKT